MVKREIAASPAQAAWCFSQVLLCGANGQQVDVVHVQREKGRVVASAYLLGMGLIGVRLIFYYLTTIRSEVVSDVVRAKRKK